MMNPVVSNGGQLTLCTSMHVEPEIGLRYRLPSGSLVEVDRVNAERVLCKYLDRPEFDPISNKYMEGEVTFTCDWLETYGRVAK